MKKFLLILSAAILSYSSVSIGSESDSYLASLTPGGDPHDTLLIGRVPVKRLSPHDFRAGIPTPHPDDPSLRAGERAKALDNAMAEIVENLSRTFKIVAVVPLLECTHNGNASLVTAAHFIVQSKDGTDEKYLGIKPESPGPTSLQEKSPANNGVSR